MAYLFKKGDKVVLKSWKEILNMPVQNVFTDNYVYNSDLNIDFNRYLCERHFDTVFVLEHNYTKRGKYTINCYNFPIYVFKRAVPLMLTTRKERI